MHLGDGGERALSRRATGAERHRIEVRRQLRQIAPDTAQLLRALGRFRREEFEADVLRRGTHPVSHRREGGSPTAAKK